VSLEMHLDSTIVRTWRPYWDQFVYTPGGCDLMHLRCIWRPCWHQVRDADGGHDRARLEECIEAVDGRCTRCLDSIQLLVHLQMFKCEEVTVPGSPHGDMAGSCRSCRGACRKLLLQSGLNWES